VLLTKRVYDLPQAVRFSSRRIQIVCALGQVLSALR
jgi:hypothetical protein